MRKGAAGLLILVLLGLIVLVIIFVSTKFVLPNPQTVQENRRIQNNAQDAINKIRQKSIEGQSEDVNK